MIISDILFKQKYGVLNDGNNHYVTNHICYNQNRDSVLDNVDL